MLRTIIAAAIVLAVMAYGARAEEDAMASFKVLTLEVVLELA
ncbi:MAG: hypothetical protein QGG19_03560 [Alphaproteobacteria bacterium]|jgi:hypothetical protein|nr:hypothetical protein [Alphaproteobacteria bacterium]MDP6256449.1 hypothetical protein [Alphaproteobacteria bacterium]MDP7053841.1 hypothetical protein [Alphaproteobacteria bacterium]MDP7227188.1 hypothetical protein [Alphaproteobacteria bacterium]MDP7461152.1 hypothetical protein [Alphaproteobacteria bacterium]|tara:strand:+ start:2718 stop:2843 length:126 start_codon:yes stop_codon:yes gene_type:complete